MGINPGEDILASHFKGTRYYAVEVHAFQDEFNSPAPARFAATALKSTSDTLAAYVGAAIHLPHGAVVTSVKAYWYRNDAAAVGGLQMHRITLSDGSLDLMAQADSDSSAGYHSKETTSIGYPTIDNVNHSYFLYVTIDPNNDKGDVFLVGVVITYTVDSPLP